MTKAYYNENDPKAAAWLRELICRGHIAPGVVDERSIVEIQPGDLAGFIQCHFFAGIGGWSHALRLAGIPDEFPIWTGSCPCQPLSCAGLGKGHADERHLWPAFYHLIYQRGPAKIVGEQVAGADGREWFAGVRADLEGMGYACGAADLCSAGVGSPNIRQRIYWLADSDREQFDGEPVRLRERGSFKAGPETAGGGAIGAGGMGDADDKGRQGFEQRWNGSDKWPARAAGLAGGLEHPEGDGWQQWGAESSGRGAAIGCGVGDFWSRYDLLPCTDGKSRRIEPGSFPLAHGVPGRVGLLRGYGNAINPHVAAIFIKAALG